MIDLGDLVPLAVSVKDMNGNPVNANTVTLTITLPDLTVVTPVVSAPSVTGQYEYDYFPTQVGRHQVRWVTVGPQASYEDTFDVRDSASRSIISLAEAKQHLNMTTSTDDEEVREMIEAVTNVIERHRGEVIARRSITETQPMGSWRRIVLRCHPVIAVTAVTDQSGQTFTPSEWVLDPDSGTMTRTNRSFHGWSDLVVTYTAGFNVIPANYILAAKIILKHIWETQRIQNIGRQPLLGQARFQGEQILTPQGQGYAMPYRAIELLGGRPPMIV